MKAERKTGMIRQYAPGILLALLPVLLLAGLPAKGGSAEKLKLKMGARGELCLTCHVDFKDKLKKRFLHTPVAEKDCTGCHDPHTSNHGKLLAADPSRVCSTCHDAMVPEGAKSAHRVVVEGQCASCHDPHASDNKSNLLKAGNELCFGCHEQVQTAVAGLQRPHNPVAENCLNCHNPHASAGGGSLLSSDPPRLCGECHETGGKMFAAFHANYPVSDADCTSCHNPHGSNRKAILYDEVHAPVAKRMCAQCHQAADAPDALKTRREGYELCRVCHSEMVNATLGKNRVHGPVLGGDGCLNCHRPHASSGKALLAGPMKQVCGDCHADTLGRHERFETKHQPIQEGDCTACHDPHGSDAGFLATKASTLELCGSCHDWQRHSSHPIGEKVSDPRNPNATMQCLSCHRSHGTEYKHMIPFATITNLCVQCHEQYKR